ncbi:transcriptional regulator, Crp/Fnr family [Denitrovibrio acetiphilus DSM 12809]|uniref:Transcriptional regulator, Crp/Fnr family n=1 Tax=Denitrovibrio acetiphilus (strain DSM 12809 / NBRC 114555 / N2460) TaxID=522772 RepID=D4H2F3_DENA2|nr:Crp/Fnr family transcriptional regulator [Denitrovibrio acetiphilus]ADD68944.1 transcriptional regulator, Crp/Fnr family [Denitrovibrio acetiphilus DSM 12809]
MIIVKGFKKRLVKDYVTQRYSSVNDCFVDNLCKSCCIKCKKKWETLFLQGECGEHIYYLVSGLVKLYRVNDSGREVIVKFIRAGESFGHGILGGVYPLCAMALSNSELLAIDREKLREEMKRDHVLMDEVLSIINKEINNLTNFIGNLSLLDCKARFISYLNNLSKEQKSTSVMLPMPKCELAMFLATTPENLSRIMRQLIDNKEIEVTGRRVVLIGDDYQNQKP